jgi:hypothetical protein
VDVGMILKKNLTIMIFSGVPDKKKIKINLNVLKILMQKWLLIQLKQYQHLNLKNLNLNKRKPPFY